MQAQEVQSGYKYSVFYQETTGDTSSQCDGTTPCTRCKSDDTICAYGKHKKTEKLVYRKGSATSLV